MNFGDERVHDRYWQKVSPEPNSGCWLWTGCVDQNGYGGIAGRIKGGGQWSKRAHRLFFEALSGEIKSGLELDHLCRTACCVNPDHLEPVSHRENVLRGRVVSRREEKKICRRGHLFSVTARWNPSGYRYCNECSYENQTGKKRTPK